MIIDTSFLTKEVVIDARADNKNIHICGEFRALFRTRTGDPLLTILGHGNWSQPTATVFAYFRGVGLTRFATGCDWLQPLGSISAPCLVGRMGYDVDFSSTT